MKKHAIDLDQMLLDHKGRPILDTPAMKDEAGNIVAEAVVLTLGNFCFASMHRPAEEDKTRTSPAAITSAHAFAMKFASGGTVELTIDEINKIRDRVAKVGWPLAFAGPALAALDVSSKGKADDDAKDA